MGNKQTHIEPLIIAYQSSTERPAETLWNAPWFADLTLQVRRRCEGSYTRTRHNVNRESLYLRRKTNRIWFAVNGSRSTRVEPRILSSLVNNWFSNLSTLKFIRALEFLDVVSLL
ncbi:hypothetical protein AVEN_247912-1 [Araneus ventricosus]|uniref:Uncharacterized protein n=1 Tax=Araneus ventricosus TaxID=182803 RepID=A0A4Y2W6R0_ARAVE|nr:hypothetical protein AVEN_247912-1 [Araneus ventricosus]